MSYNEYKLKIEDIFEMSIKEEVILPSENIKEVLDFIIEHSEKNKGVLAVIITSLLKKEICPSQDTRIHQSQMQGGYSGRSLDTKIVTPFLKKNNFPSMAESGWLTRSLESTSPYNEDYPESFNSSTLKKSFLKIFRFIEIDDISPKIILKYIFKSLIKKRNQNSKIILAKPQNQPISKIITYLEKHFSYKYNSAGASRLPVLAVYAAYQQMIKEVNRYKKYELVPLESHTASDLRTHSVGDIEVIDETKNPFEGVEIKHAIEITPEMVKTSYQKFAGTKINRYYILTTAIPNCDSEIMSQELIRLRKIHSCQIIVNGVIDSLKYYLRLLENTDDFIRNYLKLVSNDNSLKFEHKAIWNKIIEETL